MRKLAGIILCVLFFACKSTGDNNAELNRGMDIHIVSKPEINTVRMKFKVPLQIYLSDKIRDDFDFSYGASGVTVHFKQFRKSIMDAIQYSFNDNFTDFSISDKESDTGLQLLLLRADIQQTNAVKFHAVLRYEGEDVIDMSKETEPRTIMIGTTIFTYHYDTKEKLIRPLTEEAIAKMCESIYDNFLRNQELNNENFWDPLKK